MRLADEMLLIFEASSKHPYGSVGYYEEMIKQQKERLEQFKRETAITAKTSLGRLNARNRHQHIKEWEAKIKVLEKKLAEARANKK